MPVTVRHLVRYLNLRGVAGNPANVLTFESEGTRFEIWWRMACFFFFH